jgi:hypothetical protein
MSFTAFSIFPLGMLGKAFLTSADSSTTYLLLLRLYLTPSILLSNHEPRRPLGGWD